MSFQFLRTERLFIRRQLPSDDETRVSYRSLSEISQFQKIDTREEADVRASTDPKNEQSQKLLGKLGFALVESQPNDMAFRKRSI